MAATKRPRGKDQLEKKYEEGTSLTHKVLQDLYFSQFKKGYLALIPNSGQIFKLWESDLIGLNPQGKLHEFEIKSSRADWLKEIRDIREQKIDDSGRKFLRACTLEQAKTIVQTKKDKPKQRYAYIDALGKKKALSMDHVPPAKFFIMAPAGVVKPEEVPDYAGLVEFAWTPSRHNYIGKVVVQAPNIHTMSATEKQIAFITRGISLRFWKERLAA